MKNDDWEDKGTGHVRCVFLNKQEGPCIVVKSEINDAEILRSKISTEDRYVKQQETLIVWTEPDNDSDDGVDLALSFQNRMGCSEVWEEICELQQYLSNPEFDLEQLLKYQDLECMKSWSLPPANIDHIDEIALLLSQNITIPEKQLIATTLIKEQYLSKLVDLWKKVQDTDSEEHYQKMYHIFKDIILLNSIQLLEQVVSSKNVFEIMAALEHDPEQHIGTIKHSEFLQKEAKYKELVQLNDPNIENKIHQTYRLQYLKDVALARTLDEHTFGTINTLICVNNIHIIAEISGREDIIESLFIKLKGMDVQSEQLKDHLSFLSEMCDMIKSLEQKKKDSFLSNIIQT